MWIVVNVVCTLFPKTVVVLHWSRVHGSVCTGTVSHSPGLALASLKSGNGSKRFKNEFKNIIQIYAQSLCQKSHFCPLNASRILRSGVLAHTRSSICRNPGAVPARWYMAVLLPLWEYQLQSNRTFFMAMQSAAVIFYSREVCNIVLKGEGMNYGHTLSSQGNF